MVAMVVGTTSIASLGIAQAAPFGTPAFAPPSLLQNVADQEMTVVGTRARPRPGTKWPSCAQHHDLQLEGPGLS